MTRFGLGLGSDISDYFPPANQAGNLVPFDLTSWTEVQATVLDFGHIRETTDDNIHAIRYAVNASGNHIHSMDVHAEGCDRIHLTHGLAANTITFCLTEAGSCEAAGASVDQESISLVDKGIYRVQFRINLAGATNFDIRMATGSSALDDTFVGDVDVGCRIYSPCIVPE